MQKGKEPKYKLLQHLVALDTGFKGLITKVGVKVEQFLNNFRNVVVLKSLQYTF